jgi:hypothetical protein
VKWYTCLSIMLWRCKGTGVQRPHTSTADIAILPTSHTGRFITGQNPPLPADWGTVWRPQRDGTWLWRRKFSSLSGKGIRERVHTRCLASAMSQMLSFCFCSALISNVWNTSQKILNSMNNYFIRFGTKVLFGYTWHYCHWNFRF